MDWFCAVAVTELRITSKTYLISSGFELLTEKVGINGYTNTLLRLLLTEIFNICTVHLWFHIEAIGFSSKELFLNQLVWFFWAYPRHVNQGVQQNREHYLFSNNFDISKINIAPVMFYA